MESWTDDSTTARLRMPPRSRKEFEHGGSNIYLYFIFIYKLDTPWFEVGVDCNVADEGDAVMMDRSQN